MLSRGALEYCTEHRIRRILRKHSYLLDNVFDKTIDVFLEYPVVLLILLMDVAERRHEYQWRTRHSGVLADIWDSPLREVMDREITREGLNAEVLVKRGNPSNLACSPVCIQVPYGSIVSRQ